MPSQTKSPPIVDTVPAAFDNGSSSDNGHVFCRTCNPRINTPGPRVLRACCGKEVPVDRKLWPWILRPWKRIRCEKCKAASKEDARKHAEEIVAKWRKG